MPPDIVEIRIKSTHVPFFVVILNPVPASWFGCQSKGVISSKDSLKGLLSLRDHCHAAPVRFKVSL